AAATWSRAARAQQAGKLPTIGFMGATYSVESQRGAAFVQRLRELAWVDGRNLAIEYRLAEGRPQRFGNRGRVRPDQGRCHCHSGSPGNPRGKASYSGHPDRGRAAVGPGRDWLGRESGATGPQRHRSGEPDI